LFQCEKGNNFEVPFEKHISFNTISEGSLKYKGFAISSLEFDMNAFLVGFQYEMVG
jgi:hypothetical protein